MGRQHPAMLGRSFWCPTCALKCKHCTHPQAHTCSRTNAANVVGGERNGDRYVDQGHGRVKDKGTPLLKEGSESDNGRMISDSTVLDVDAAAGVQGGSFSLL